MKRLWPILITAAWLAAACGPVSTPAPAPAAIPTQHTPSTQPGAVSIDPAVDLGPISPYIYGTNYGPMHAIPVEMMPLVQEAGFTVLRYPGGAWSDATDIKNFQIDQLMSFCEIMGTIPTITVRLLDGKPETAAGLVRYANIEKGYGIKYWSIGNEPTLFQEQENIPYDTEIFNREWRAIAEAMKAVDPTILLMGPELHQWGIDLASTLKDSSGRDWMTEFLKVNGDLVDIVTVHRYPLFRPGTQMVTIPEMRDNLPEWPQLVIYLRELIQTTTGRDLPVAFTEVNSSPTGTSGGAASPDSFYNAIWYADVLGRMIDQDVFMINQWVISQRTTGLGLIKGNEVRPTLYTFYLYKHFGSQQVFAHSGLDGVTAYAARREDGKLTLMLINLMDVEQKVPVIIAGYSPTEVELWLLDVDHNAENMGVQSWPADGMLTLPAQSASLYVTGD